jgi:cytochrome c oxidase subunit IV
MNNYFKAKGANQPAIVLAIMVLAFAATVAWFAYVANSRGGYILAAGLAIVGFLIPQAIMVANQWERAVVLRLALQLPFFKMGALSDRLVSSTPE